MSRFRFRVSSLVMYALLLLLVAGVAYGDGFLLRLCPAAGVPLGDNTVAIRNHDEDLFQPGGQVGLAGHFNALGLLQPTVNADVHYVPFGVEGAQLLIASGGAGAAVSLPVGGRFRLMAFGEGGYFYGTVTPEISGMNPYYSVGAGFGMTLGSGLLVMMEANFADYIDLYRGLGVGVSVGLGSLSTAPAAAPPEREAPGGQRPQPIATSETKDAAESGLRISDVQLGAVFPVLFRYYNSSPVGTVTFTKESGGPVENLKVQFVVPEFMSAARVSGEIAEVAEGESASVDLFALFTEDVLNLTEGSTVAATVSYTFAQDNQIYQGEEVLTVEFRNRNAITWDDDRKAAVFVTAQDEDVMRFSRNVAAVISDSSVAAIPREFQLGLAMHAAVGAHGVSYVIDPTTPYEELSANANAVDLLQFPRQTLQFKAGDCDDLSILYASLLQAVGVDTAFVTIPGHIFLAFRLSITPADARATFLRSGDLIYRDDDTVWLPLEITLIKEGFLEAWAVGARQYRDHYTDETVGFFPIKDAWSVYQPVTFRSTMNVALPDQTVILPEFQRQLQRFINREIYEQEQTLLARIEQSPTMRSINRLGVLYGRYGLTDRALEQFGRVLQMQDYGPALVNVGNLHYLARDLDQAVTYYQRAADAAPDNAAVLLAVARANFELENYGTVTRYYDRLLRVDPDLAGRFAYLSPNADISTRASDAAQMSGLVVWADEEEE